MSTGDRATGGGRPVATPTGISLTVRTTTPDETRDLGAAIADALRPGDVVALTGELGAGKTCFVQGAARGLGVADRVTSPTFVLVKQYAGRIPVVHCDVYRLERLQDVLDLGDEVMATDVVTFLEWGDAVAPLLPTDLLEVELTIEDDDAVAVRRIQLTGTGAWMHRVEELADRCSAWRPDH